ncbi:hypothetical protein WICMUC_002304 [Wickerhamomyces mucosus]|uniref:HIT-type domain-containing protein n=1 Tax=Wickerhamomyces mucosus TaxID=1378264 RepID=A0A9P8TDY6_9ASCO|nr:hypothetical protein WICMUC_002304 [Wickerhamomyces mucosus]
MNCEICSLQPSKYKCPQCKIAYCSLTCFKSPEHSHSEIPITQTEQDSTAKINLEKKTNINLYDSILLDKDMQYLLRDPEIQEELRKIYEALQADNDRDLDKTNDYLLDLRRFGSNKNDKIEDFCQLFIHLQSSKDSK